MNNNITNHYQSQSEGGNNPRATKRRRRRRRRAWDSAIVGIGFSLVFVLLLTKVAHTTPCDALDYFSIDTKTCMLASGSNTSEGELATQHGLGFSIIIQYALLALELINVLNGHIQQFLQNIGLQL
jgi:hypothetical protein